MRNPEEFQRAASTSLLALGTRMELWRPGELRNGGFKIRCAVSYICDWASTGQLCLRPRRYRQKH